MNWKHSGWKLPVFIWAFGVLASPCRDWEEDQKSSASHQADRNADETGTGNHDFEDGEFLSRFD